MRQKELHAVNFFQPIRPTSWSSAHFQTVLLTDSSTTTHLMFVTTASQPVSPTVCLCLHKCMQARLPLQPWRWHCHTFRSTHAHTRLSIHANAHFSHIFFPRKQKYTGLQRDNGRRQVTTATSREGLEQGMCVWNGRVSEVLIRGKVGKR